MVLAASLWLHTKWDICKCSTSSSISKTNILYNLYNILLDLVLFTMVHLRPVIWAGRERNAVVGKMVT